MGQDHQAARHRAAVIPAASRPSNAGVVGGAMSRDSAMRIPQSGVRRGKLVLPARILIDAGNRLKKLTGVLGLLCADVCCSVFHLVGNTGLAPQVKNRGVSAMRTRHGRTNIPEAG
jgi:hypothetical protein